MKTLTVKKNYIMTAAAFILIIAAGCAKSENKMDAVYLDTLNLVSAGGYYSFSGTINTDQTSTCGEAVADTTTTTTSSVSAAATSGTTTSNIFKVTSYYIFELGKSDFTFNYPLGRATMFIKYKYNETKKSYSLTPSTTTTTCPTTDYIKCKGTSGVSPVCETADSVNCGGTYSFSFVSVNENADYPFSEDIAPDILFQASSGTISWENGYALSTGKDTVVRSNLDINMLDSDGKIFKATVECNIPSL